MFHQEFSEFTHTEMHNAIINTERQKNDYINLVIDKVRKDISCYDAEEQKLRNLNRLFQRILSPGDINKDFYILSRTKEFRKMGKYLLYISKKIDDKQVSFDNLIKNVTDDADFIREEVLAYMSDPVLKPSVEFNEQTWNEQSQEEEEIIPVKDNFNDKDITQEITLYEEDDRSSPAKIYMHLIQSDEHDGEKAFELPEPDQLITEQVGSASGQAAEAIEEDDAVFELPDGSSTGIEQEAIAQNFDDTASDAEEDIPSEEVLTIPEASGISDTESSFKIKKKFSFGFEEDGDLILGERVDAKEDENISKAETEQADEKADEEKEKERIALSDEFSSEIDEYIKKTENEPLEAEEEDHIANTEFLEYEQEVRICNTYLAEEMTNFLEGKLNDRAIRQRTVESIIDAARLLEERSKHMSFELISNIYQAISLSFEKIVDGKYDISESTVSLLKQGLELIESLIRGEDYFVYKSAVKSIENIRKNLTEEKKKKEEYSTRLRAKEEIQRELSSKYPLKEQRHLVNNILSNIRNIESIFKSTDYTDGEFHTYEALKILSGSLNNFRSIVGFSKELDLPVLAQISEAGYNFVKYLCNYRKDPATPENKEIFDYLIYTQKSLLLGRHVEDTEVFISYLNDPIKIFSKNKDHQTNSQTR